MFNFSTGRVICKTVFDNEVTAMDHDHTGQLIFCGDAQVSLFVSIYRLISVELWCFFLEIVQTGKLCREVYTQFLWTLAQVHCRGCIPIEVETSTNLQSQLCSIERFPFWRGVLFCWLLLETEICLSLGLFVKKLFSLFFLGLTFWCYFWWIDNRVVLLIL